MEPRDARLLTRELRSIYKSVDDMRRRMAASHMTGKVAEVDGNRVRLELLAEGAGGKPFLSPWVQLQEAAGTTGTHFPVAVGDPMRLFSPQGELGPQSLAIRDGYTEDAPDPASNQEFTIAHGGCTARIVDGAWRFEGAAHFTGPELTHNGKNIGDDHTHLGVTPGGATTDIPA